MSVTLTVNNTPFDYPEQGEQQPWGEAATGWAVEVTNVLSSLKGSADIIETSFPILDNQSTPASIIGLFFDINTVRSFVVQASAHRAYGVGLEKNQHFTITGINTGSSFDLQQESIGDSGISFSILPSGQFQYTSSNLGGLTGTLKFRAIGILKS